MNFSKLSRQQWRKRFLRLETLEPRLALAAEVEPNDSMATANLITATSENLTGIVTRLGDQDYFCVNLTQGQGFWASTWYSTATSFIGGVEILDSSGRVLATRVGNDDIEIVAPRDGAYYLRMTASGSFGDYTRKYAIQVGVRSSFATPEVEPNDLSTNATALSSSATFRGTLATAADQDWFSFTGNAGQALKVDFFNAPTEAPAVIVYRPDGTELGRSDSGLGGLFTLPVSGSYRFAIAGATSNGTYIGGYVGSIELSSSTVMVPSSATSFDSAVPMTFSTFVNFGGVLDSRVPQFISFQVNTFSHVSMTLDVNSSQRKGTLYNDRGQILEWTLDSTGTDEPQYAFTPGKYFLSVEALNDTGLGPYSYSLGRNTPVTATQRDTGLFFLDLNAQQPKYAGYAWSAPFGVPAAADYLAGLFGSRYAAYDAELTRTLPTNQAEMVAQGYGRFTGFGSGGQTQGGKAGTRRPSASAITGCSMTTWTSLDWGCATTMLHEFAHGTGLDHPRNVQNLLSYTNEDEVFPAGSNYSFQLDSRIPTSSSANTRDYLDWVLQPGTQMLETEPNNTRASATALQNALMEMQGDLRTGPVSSGGGGASYELKLVNINNDNWPDIVASVNSKNQISVQLALSPGNFGAATNYTPGFTLPTSSEAQNVLGAGDLNGDGRDDIAVAGRSSNTVVTYLSNLDGTLTPASTVAAGTNPSAVEIRDVNVDGRGDLITANSDGSIGVHLGNGDGTFQARQQFATNGGAAKDVLVADVNGDGIPDVLTANQLTSTAVSLLRGVGDGTFQSGQTFGTGGASVVFFEDVNGDGTRDLVASDGWIKVMLGAGSGTFGAMNTSAPGLTPVAMGDINGDGRADMVGYAAFAVPGSRVSLANADGSFGSAIPIVTTNNTSTVTAGDLDGDGYKDIVSAQPSVGSFRTNFGMPNDPRNDRVVVFGEITSPTDVEVYSFTAAAGQTFAFDIEAAEFQRPLDAQLSVYDSSGNLLATNNDALDRDTGITSVDPYLTHTFATAGTYYAQVSSTKYTAGSYRFKLSPQSSWDKRPPRVIGLLPAGPSTIARKQQFQIYFDDQIDPASLTAANIIVQGATTGLRTGTATFDPFESALFWTGDAYLPPDTYTITLNGGVGGIRDLKGNLLDGETDGSFAFPEVSGNGTAGGNFVGSFTISNLNFPVGLNLIRYERNASNRGMFTIALANESSMLDSPQLIARGAGPDALFNTADDRILPLDVAQDAIEPTSYLTAFTRGIPDPDQYRIEGTIRGTSGATFNLSGVINVAVEIPETALFTTAALTQTGVVGSYVNSSLQSYAPQNDWRATQTISGTRIDPRIDYTIFQWGSRAEVGLTGGSDNDWNPFSVQWDGYLQVPVDNTRLVLKSINGSRMWIDLNNDGVFNPSGNEFINNAWGTAGNIGGTASSPIAAGTYRIRVQYESGDGQAEQAYLEWITPDIAGKADGFGHGPSVIDTSIQPGSVLAAAGVNTFDVIFSGAINPATLTTANFKLRYSPDATFYNGNDVYLTDADGVIAWNGAQHKATFQTQQPFAMGYYLVELNGDAGGIADNIGQRLDGEYLDSYIAGNTLSMHWQDTPSGDGIAGGDYVAAFSVVNFSVNVSVSSVGVSEDGSTNLVYTFTRSGDIESAGTVNFTVSGGATFGTDYSQTGAATFNGTSGTITFAPGASTATLTIDPTADAVIESDEAVVVTLAPGTAYNLGAATVATSFINNDEPITYRVTVVTPTATGVVVDFNRQLNPSTLNLYVGAPDVTLVGATVGNIRGSLIVDPYLRRMTFIQTTGTLPPDTYTLTLRANGVRDALTLMLDGDADGVAGGDYVQQFVVAAAAANAVTVSLPNFARGPQQTLGVSATATGILLTLSNASGITSATLQVKYDPTLITFTGATIPSGLPAGAAVSLDTSINGIATIQFTSPTALSVGAVNFVNLLATVPANAPYRNKQVLDVANVVLNGGSIPAIDDDGVHVVAYFGDVTANGTYSAQDAAQVARLAVGLDAGLAPFKLLDPTIIADVNGNGSFSATDTSRMLQAAVGITTAEIPPLPQPAVSLLSGGPDPKLSIPRNLTATAGQLLTIPVEIDSIVDLTGNGLASADLVLYFDPLVFDVQRVSLGSLLTPLDGWMISSRIDAIAGRIDISLASSEPLEGKFVGELVRLQATVRTDARGGDTAINLASTSRSRSTQLNEGFLTLIPAPTDAANDPIDGLVTISAATVTATATARLIDNRLLIIGTHADDLLLIKPTIDGSQVIVRAGNRILGTFARPESIAVDGLTGVDYVYVDPAAPATLIATATDEITADDLIFSGDNAQWLTSSLTAGFTPTIQSQPLSPADLALLQLLDQWTLQNEDAPAGGGALRRRR